MGSFEADVQLAMGSSLDDPPETDLDYISKPENYTGSNFTSMQRHIVRRTAIQPEDIPEDQVSIKDSESPSRKVSYIDKSRMSLEESCMKNGTDKPRDIHAESHMESGSDVHRDVTDEYVTITVDERRDSAKSSCHTSERYLKAHRPQSSQMETEESWLALPSKGSRFSRTLPGGFQYGGRPVSGITGIAEMHVSVVLIKELSLAIFMYL